jgi:hypothetical protein
MTWTVWGKMHTNPDKWVEHSIHDLKGDAESQADALACYTGSEWLDAKVMQTRKTTTNG